MAARGEPQDGVLGEQPLGRLEAAEAESFVWMIERQLELSPSARVHPVRRFRRKPQPHLPEQLAPGEPEAVASPHPHEMLDRGALELGRRAAREIADAHIWAAPLPLDHRRRRCLLAPVANECEAYPNGALVSFNGAIDITQIHIRK